MKSLTIKAIHQGQRRLGIAVYELAHATYRDSGSDLEIMFDASAQKRLTVSAFDIMRKIWVLDRQPVVRLA